MFVSLTRDSVCAADDLDPPHEQVIIVADSAMIGDVLQKAIGSGYLPFISGGRATWSAETSMPLAVIAQEWTSLKLLASNSPLAETADIGQEPVRIHFKYYAQEEPEFIFERLSRLKDAGKQ